ncbi:hypothetical protein [Azohydromonas aeria]|uniref:hypothetical protein n=1 Tax=Azohydromonas aeria TaxID=2590212 RepID=UPI0012F76F70|nr:hypothetical protein [Azohydromonas aeria]
MNTPFAIQAGPDDSYPEYATAFADLERRAARGEFTLAQWRHEVHTLRQRCTGGRPIALLPARRHH